MQEKEDKKSENTSEDLLEALAKIIRENFPTEEDNQLVTESSSDVDMMVEDSGLELPSPDTEETLAGEYTPKLLTPYRDSVLLSKNDFVNVILDINVDPEEANLNSPNHPSKATKGD